MNPIPQYDPTFFNDAKQTFQQAASAAMPTDQLRDTAASRIRARLAGQASAQNQQLQDMYAARGRLGSGAYQGAFQQQNAAQQGALASGLADNEATYLKARQEGANILKGIGEGYGALGIGSSQAQSQLAGAETDRMFGEGRLANERGVLQESIDRRKNEQVIEAMKAFGEYGNVAGEENYKGFSGAIKSLLEGAGVHFDPTNFTAPSQNSGSNSSGGSTTGGPQVPSGTIRGSNGASYNLGQTVTVGPNQRPPGLPAGYLWTPVGRNQYRVTWVGTGEVGESR